MPERPPRRDSGVARWAGDLSDGGLRIGEALALRRRHIDVSSGRLTVAEAMPQVPGGPVIDTPKNHQRRELAVPAFVVQLLRERLATLPDGPDVFVFPGHQAHTADRQQSYHGFRRRFLVAVRSAGLGRRDASRPSGHARELGR
ncbi:tyrosine-type recombinase/integrase [Micromonospora sp. LH3U1]|uniref:tyrosine-type recombinase/integrase n=1 Tax=Micromonospora sp. LH3U1 TaxID=3018339 RepID=UPI002349DC46|nr:tyrosine-type recombinase/integrase [Micromonospora sp. LH3U1]WCN82139.1 tyrosine-type recombinase/integrase [Micromonospora sp. LH3U1]